MSMLGLSSGVPSIFLPASRILRCTAALMHLCRSRLRMQKEAGGRDGCTCAYVCTYTSFRLSLPAFLLGPLRPVCQVGPGQNWLDRHSLVGPSHQGPSAHAHGGRSNPDCTEHPVNLPGKVVETLPEPRGLSCRRVQRRPCLACLQENTFSTGYQP